MDVVYFSSISENTHRFVLKLDLPTERVHRLPLRRVDAPYRAERPFILITPTYGAGSAHSTIPKQVIRFLNEPGNRALLRGVIAAGNTNFGQHYGLAGRLVADKCGVPHMHSFEVLGMPEDVQITLDILEKL